MNGPITYGHEHQSNEANRNDCAGVPSMCDTVCVCVCAVTPEKAVS